MYKRSRDASVSSSEDIEASSSYIAAPSPSKLIEIEEAPTTTSPFMSCDLPPHKEPLFFTTYEDYEVHYSKTHTNRCSACGKNFPTNHFLNLHIEENHNPLREVLAGRGEKTYGCFVEDCERKCSTPQKRRLHLIDKHMFPKGYNFRIVDKGIDQIDSMLSNGPRRRLSGFHDKQETHHGPTGKGQHRGSTDTTSQSKQATSTRDAGQSRKMPARYPTPQPQVETLGRSSHDEPDIDQLGAAMTALRFVPPSVQLKKQPKG